MPDDVLTRMAVDGYGPVILRDSADGRFVATVGGRDVTVTGGHQAFRFETNVAVSWPGDTGLDEALDPISIALEELAHIHRPDLVTIDEGHDGDMIVTMWIPSQDATPARVASAVYSTSRIATLALSTVTDLVTLYRAGADDEAEATSV